MKKPAPLILAALLCALSLIAMAFALGRQPETAEFTPPPFESAAEAGTPDVPDGLGYSILDCRAYQVGICGKLTAGEIWLTNPAENSVWLKVRVLDESGRILGETGLVRPGEYVRFVTLTDVPEAGTPIVLKIMAYEPESYRSAGAASLNTVIY